MNRSNSEIGTSGIFTALLTVAFIVLKLTDTIAWSWWWVLAPLWIPVVLGALVAGATLLFVSRKLR